MTKSEHRIQSGRILDAIKHAGLLEDQTFEEQAKTVKWASKQIVQNLNIDQPDNKQQMIDKGKATARPVPIPMVEPNPVASSVYGKAFNSFTPDPNLPKGRSNI